jgi:hypothetical protein
MSLIIIAIICLGIYYLYGFITDQETKRQRKNDPKRKESLEFYTITKFSLRAKHEQ